MRYQAEHNITGQGWTRCRAAFVTREEAVQSERMRFGESPSVRIVETTSRETWEIRNGEVRRVS